MFLRNLGTGVLLALLGAGCGHGHDHGHDHGDGDGHHHVAPHGGVLVELGENEFAHVELLHDPEEGRLTVWLLDGAAEAAVRSTQESLVFQREGAEFTLAAQASSLTGETVGDSSQFETVDEGLKGPLGEGVLRRVEVLGSVFEDVPLTPAH